MAMRHIPPLVIYEDSPISYMAEGQALKFYQGEGDATNGKVDDSSVINYMIVRTLQEEAPGTQKVQTSINNYCKSEGDHDHQFGCRLVGIIPCSDAFGVDLIISRYQKQTEAHDKM